MANISEMVKAMVHFDHCGSGHHGDTKRAAENERDLVEKMRDNIITKIINPYSISNSEDLVNIATGQKASSSEVIHARDIGIKAMEEAEANNLDKIPVPNITTFVCQERATKK